MHFIPLSITTFMRHSKMQEPLHTEHRHWTEHWTDRSWTDWSSLFILVHTLLVVSIFSIVLATAIAAHSTLVDVKQMIPEMRTSLLDLGQLVPEIKNGMSILEQLCTASSECQL